MFQTLKLFAIGFLVNLGILIEFSCLLYSFNRYDCILFQEIWGFVDGARAAQGRASIFLSKQNVTRAIVIVRGACLGNTHKSMRQEVCPIFLFFFLNYAQ